MAVPEYDVFAASTSKDVIEYRNEMEDEQIEGRFLDGVIASFKVDQEEGQICFWFKPRF